MTLQEAFAEAALYADKGPSVSRAACAVLVDALLWAGPAEALFDPAALSLPTGTHVAVLKDPR